MSIACSKSSDGRVLTMHLPREFDFHAHKDFREAQLNSKGVTDFILDFSQTTHMDSSALGMLLLMREETSKTRSRIKLINCHQNVKALLELANFHKLLDVV